ncbi:hypothetical protein BCU70_15785 [Vibrio sp. 10N.286.49.C2]|uniref:flagellar hook-length control protein FliK n=1 Tax=unclassified Vibrio TaxID=2614977 RepID=UPI000CB3E33E|nr:MULTISPECIES: flagellar hook-length control protein FliK [unclassified Vibrio]PMH37358.1 hypothetical protein BCU70_15785 [Vibrio sp. 10N.286.49.C2]PMH49446.1 hypothetical protein BCU66_20450 [Vibrio sp. 10N.286.49.B1]PMH83869.1 hypothetical protein BCU58_13125 [Vibrio sp. 10N.286.48.B7]
MLNSPSATQSATAPNTTSHHRDDGNSSSARAIAPSTQNPMTSGRPSSFKALVSDSKSESSLTEHDDENLETSTGSPQLIGALLLHPQIKGEFGLDDAHPSLEFNTRLNSKNINTPQQLSHSNEALTGQRTTSSMPSDFAYRSDRQSVITALNQHARLSSHSLSGDLQSTTQSVLGGLSNTTQSNPLLNPNNLPLAAANGNAENVSAHSTAQWANVRVDTQAGKWGEQMLQVLNDRVTLQAQQNLQEARIRLDPPDLGKLDLTVRVEGDRLSVQINANATATREALMQVSDRLRHELQNQNFLQVDVQVGSGDSHTASSQSQQAEDEKRVFTARETVGDSTKNPSHSAAERWLNIHA